VLAVDVTTAVTGSRDEQEEIICTNKFSGASPRSFDAKRAHITSR